MNARTRRLLGGLTLLALTLLVLESGLRLLVSQPGFLQLLARDGDQGWGDAAWRLIWVNELHPRRPEWERLVQHSPTRGWALRPDLRDLALGGGLVVSSNRRGLRGVRNHEEGRRPGGARILAIGDSFMFGDEVANTESLPAQLELLLPGSEVINLGVPGYGHDQMLIALQEEGLRYQPDVLLIGFVTGDMDRNLLGFRDYAKPRFELVDGSLSLQGSPVPTPETLRAQEFRRLKLLDLVAMASHRARWPADGRRERAERVTQAILDVIVATAKDSGAVPVFLYMPVGAEIALGAAGPSLGELFLRGYCRELGLLQVSAAGALKPEPMAPMGGPDRHWTAAQNRAAAEVTAALLRSEGLAPGPAP